MTACIRLLALAGVLIALLASAALAQPATPPANDIADYPACDLCGMDRAKFASSRMLTQYDDGSVFPSCSIHCTLVDMVAHLDKTPTGIWVANMNDKTLMPAEQAVWVIVEGTPGVMTRNAKWAFRDQGAAQAYAEQSGGRVATWDDAVQATFLDLYQDTMMIQKKRKAKRMKMGS